MSANNPMTEEEARKKWCPMARHPEGNRMPYGGDGTEAAEGDKQQFAVEMADLHPCIASDCMMWRWQPSLSVNNPSRVPGYGQYIKHETGYCGFAGTPHA